jgi:hypothetical protein
MGLVETSGVKVGGKFEGLRAMGLVKPSGVPAGGEFGELSAVLLVDLITISPKIQIITMTKIDDNKTRIFFAAVPHKPEEAILQPLPFLPSLPKIFPQNLVYIKKPIRWFEFVFS